MRELKGLPGLKLEPDHEDVAEFQITVLAGTSSGKEEEFAFSISCPNNYPFKPPTWRWQAKPPGYHPCLGPDGIVSVDMLTQWSPVNSLASVLLELFPDCPRIRGHFTAVTQYVTQVQVRFEHWPLFPFHRRTPLLHTVHRPLRLTSRPHAGAATTGAQ